MDGNIHWFYVTDVDKEMAKFWLVIFSSGVILALVMVKSDTLAGYLRTLINNLLNRESLDIPYQIQWLGFLT